MKNKSILSLVELSVMMLVFALAAVLCMQAFLWANDTARESVMRDEALLRAQNAVELIKHSNGDMEKAAELLNTTVKENNLTVFYTENWEQTTSPDTYLLIVTPIESENKLLGKAEAAVFYEDTCLVTITAAWQGVSGDD